MMFLRVIYVTVFFIVGMMALSYLLFRHDGDEAIYGVVLFICAINVHHGLTKKW